MRKNVVLSVYNIAAYLIKHRQLCRKNVQPKVSFPHAIDQMSKHLAHLS